MKATFPLKPLSEAIRTALGVVPTRTTKDILKNIKLSVTGEIATIIATDNESSIVIYVRGIESQRSGSVLLPASKLASIVSEMTGPVVLEESGGKVTIKSGRAKFVLQTENPDDFPQTKEFSAESFITVPGSVLKRMLKGVLFCCDTVSTRYALGAVCFEYDGKRLTLIATDGKRLALDSCDVAATGSVAPVVFTDGILVVQRSLIALERCLGDDPVDISLTSSNFAIRCGDVGMSCQMVQGRFPDYKRVRSPNPTHQLDMIAGPFITALRQVMLVTAEESRGVKYVFRNGTLTMSSSGADIGESEVEIPISFDGETIAVMDSVLTIAATKMLDQSQPFKLDLIEEEAGKTGRIVFKVGNWECMQLGLSQD